MDGTRTRGFWKGWLRPAVALGLLLVGTALFAQTITLLHVNDTHSHLVKWGPKDASLDGTLGGIAKAATIIGQTRATDPNVLVLHAGDAFHGDLMFNAFFGVPDFQLMKQLGYDAMAVGNHEFDYGPGPLANALNLAYGASTLPLLSANLDLTGYPALGTWIKPSMMKEIGGIKVGIFGMTIPNVPTSRPAPVVILGGDDPTVLLGIAGTQAAILRAQGAQVVIMLSHLGFAYDQAVAQNVPGIDIIVGGHDHYVFPHPVTFTNPAGKPTVVLQAGCFYRYIGKMHFTYDNGAVTVDDYSLVSLDATVPDAPSIAAAVSQLQQGVVAKYGDVYHTVVATAKADMTKDYDPSKKMRDTAMGNLVTDALRKKTGTDIAVTANGLISEGLYEGPVVGDDLFRAVSFGYDMATGLGLKIATFKITGAQLMLGLSIGPRFLPYNEDIVMQVSGMRYAYNSDRDPDYRLKPASVTIHGEPIRMDKVYTVTTDEGVASLIPAMGIQVTDLQILPDLEYNVLRDYVHGLGSFESKSKGRVKDAAKP